MSTPDTVVFFFNPTTLAFSTARSEGDVEIDQRKALHLITAISKGFEIRLNSKSEPYAINTGLETLSPLDCYNLQLTSLNRDYELCCDSIRGDYPVTETSTWPYQFSEAVVYKAWLQSDQTTEPPKLFFIEQLSEDREVLGVGEGLEDLVDRIINNATMYNKVMARITSYRHSLEKKLKEGLHKNDIAILSSLHWDFDEYLKG